MSRAREFLQEGAGRKFGTALVVVAIFYATYMIWKQIRPSEAETDASSRWFVNSETGYAFKASLKMGDQSVVICPDTGQRTGYLAEFCYWTADGQAKDEPDKVILNSTLGKPEPTFCPYCHRLVVAHNPPPEPGKPPPPTEAEWHAKHPLGLRPRGY